MPRALFVGGVVAGQILEVGDPPPAEHHVRDVPGLLILSQAGRGIEDVYHRRDVAIEWNPGTPTTYVVYVAVPEAAALGDPKMAPHVLQHVTRIMVESGFAVRPGGEG